MGIYGLILLTFSIIILFFSADLSKIFELPISSDAEYLVIKCNIKARDTWTEWLHDGVLTKVKLKIWCKDLNGFYIDDFFSCNKDTYERSDEVDIIVVKTRSGKAYINLFDRMWLESSRIVKYNK